MNLTRCDITPKYCSAVLNQTHLFSEIHFYHSSHRWRAPEMLCVFEFQTDVSKGKNQLSPSLELLTTKSDKQVMPLVGVLEGMTCLRSIFKIFETRGQTSLWFVYRSCMPRYRPQTWFETCVRNELRFAFVLRMLYVNMHVLNSVWTFCEKWVKIQLWRTAKRLCTDETWLLCMLMSDVWLTDLVILLGNLFW